MAGVKFTQSAARRIAAATRAYEGAGRDQPPIRFRRVSDGEAESLRIARTQQQWLKGTTQTLILLYATCDEEGDGSAGDSETIEAENKFFTVAADRVVIIGQALNGCWYMVGAESCDDEASGLAGGCCPSIGGEDLTAVGNYDQGKKQVLAHDFGCLTWIDTDECDPSSGEGSS